MDTLCPGRTRVERRVAARALGTLACQGRKASEGRDAPVGDALSCEALSMRACRHCTTQSAIRAWRTRGLKNVRVRRIGGAHDASNLLAYVPCFMCCDTPRTCMAPYVRVLASALALLSHQVSLRTTSSALACTPIPPWAAAHASNIEAPSSVQTDGSWRPRRRRRPHPY